MFLFCVITSYSIHYTKLYEDYKVEVDKDIAAKPGIDAVVHPQWFFDMDIIAHPGEQLAKNVTPGADIARAGGIVFIHPFSYNFV